MILVDANILLYAYDVRSPHHEAAREFWERRLSETPPVGLAWITVAAFLRIGTNTRAFARPLALAEATRAVSSWLARPMVGLVGPGPGHWAILADLLARSRATGPLVADAHLAALAMEHGARLCSTDRDFARFPGLDWQDPLVA